MFLDVLPFKNDTARLVRVYGDEPLHHPAGGSARPGGGHADHHRAGGLLLLREAPAVCLRRKSSAAMRWSPDGTARLLRAFGRDLTGASHARYDLDFEDGDASTAARSGEEALHPLCGSFLEELVLPGSLRVIGSCAFYNCRRLRRLSAGAGS